MEQPHLPVQARGRIPSFKTMEDHSPSKKFKRRQGSFRSTIDDIGVLEKKHERKQSFRGVAVAGGAAATDDGGGSLSRGGGAMSKTKSFTMDDCLGAKTIDENDFDFEVLLGEEELLPCSGAAMHASDSFSHRQSFRRMPVGELTQSNDFDSLVLNFPPAGGCPAPAGELLGKTASFTIFGSGGGSGGHHHLDAS
ncbi:unnamed protein product, partial [Phaeothamnion confervicola]